MIGDQVVWPRAPEAEDLRNRALRIRVRVDAEVAFARFLIFVFELDGEVFSTDDIDYPGLPFGVVLRWKKIRWWRSPLEWPVTKWQRRRVRRLLEANLPESVQFVEEGP